MKRRRAAAGGWVGAVVALALGLSLAACSATGPASIVDQQTLRIGVKADQPGLGLRLPDGRFAGFDVDVARYVAAELGVRPDHITFVPVTSATRQAALENGSVDMVLRPIRSPLSARRRSPSAGRITWPTRTPWSAPATPRSAACTTSRESGCARSLAPTPGSVSRRS